MPELHANQIRWEAPEPQKVAFDKPDLQPLAQAFGRLGEVADDIAVRQAKMLDEDLRADLELAEKEANQLIDDSASATADYDNLSEKALSKVQEAFYRYDNATRVRFTREHKTYFDELQLAVADKILKKKASQLENDVEINIPQWTTEAVNRGKSGLQWMLNEKIAKTLEGLSSPETIAKLQFKAKHLYDTASVNNGLNGDEAAVRKTVSDLQNPKIYDTLNAYERSVSIVSGKSKLESIEKSKKSETDPLLSRVTEMYATYAATQDSASQDKLYKQIVGLDPSPIIIGTTVSEDGLPMSELLYMEKYPMSVRLDLANKVSNSYDKFNVAESVRQNLYDNDMRKMLIEYKQAHDDHSSNQASMMLKLDKMRRDDPNRYIKLDKETRKDIDSLINNELNSRIEAFNAPDFYVDNILWTGHKFNEGTPTRDVLVSRIKNGRTKMSNPAFVLPGEEPAFPSNDVTRGEFKSGTNVAAPGRSEGGLLQDIIQTWKYRFDKDMERDSVAEYALITAFTLKAFRDAGKLSGTRLEQSDRTYVVSLMDTLDGLQRDGDYNKPIMDSDENKIERFYTNFLGGNITKEEREIIKDVEKWARTGQATRSFDSMERANNRPEPAYTGEEQKFNMGGAYLQPAHDMLETIWLGSKTNQSITQAAKRVADE